MEMYFYIISLHRDQSQSLVNTVMHVLAPNETGNFFSGRATTTQLLNKECMELSRLIYEEDTQTLW
jgi:hypothetical protein